MIEEFQFTKIPVNGYDRVQYPAMQEVEVKVLSKDSPIHDIPPVVIMNRVELILRSFMWKLEKKALLRTPTTWWDHFKERWFPSFLKTLFPVNYTTHYANAVLNEQIALPHGREFFYYWNTEDDF